MMTKNEDVKMHNLKELNKSVIKSKEPYLLELISSRQYI